MKLQADGLNYGAECTSLILNDLLLFIALHKASVCKRKVKAAYTFIFVVVHFFHLFVATTDLFRENYVFDIREAQMKCGLSKCYSTYIITLNCDRIIIICVCCCIAQLSPLATQVRT